MDELIFGDNQFFGINHMSEEKAHAQSVRFADADSILRVMDAAYACGIRAFMFSTHERVAELCDRLRADPGRFPAIRLYPVLPYAHKYANAVAEKGVLQTIRDATGGSLISTLARGGWAAVARDPAAAMRLLVDAELKMFRGLNTPVVLLQNIVTDLLLGLGMTDLFAQFSQYVRERFAAEAGFITMNLPVLVDELEAVGLSNPIVCSSVNSIGYLMNPSREACEETIRTRHFRPMAMSVFASGAVSPQEAIQYVVRLRRIQSIVFGASTRAHIEQTVELITSLRMTEAAMAQRAIPVRQATPASVAAQSVAV